jgi:TRAP-type C4-dicarboxylate transport system permease small subunit
MLLLLVGFNVLVRLFPLVSSGWTDELIELAFAWMIFMGSAALARERLHFRADMILLALRGTRAGRTLDLALKIAGLAFFGIFTLLSWDLAVAATNTTPALDLPRIFWYGVMPVSGAIMLAYAVRDLVARE